MALIRPEQITGGMTVNGRLEAVTHF